MKTGVAHAENFPVASWLCPPHLRAPIVAIYGFARTADDLADEGNATAEQRLAQLKAYRRALERACPMAPEPPPPGGIAATASPDDATAPASDMAWPEVFGPLAQQAKAHQLPVRCLHDLLDAFEQDVRRTAREQHYTHHDELLDYCKRSANPVGRLLLHLYGVSDPQRLQESDCICTSLQLINFWQDLSVDLPRGRHYLPLAELQAFGLSVDDFAPNGARPVGGGVAGAARGIWRPHPRGETDNLNARKSALLAHLVLLATQRMAQGAPLVHHLPGRAGWELRLVVQGGLLVAERTRARGAQPWSRRPRVGLTDLPRLLWRAWRMHPGATPPHNPNTLP